MRRSEATFAALLIALSAGCYSGKNAPEPGQDSDGATEDGGETDTDGNPPVPDEVSEEVGISGLRRLSIEEYRQTVGDLLGFEPEQVAELLPSDTLTPFDNDYTLQSASEPLIGGLDILAGDIADAVIADPDLRAAIVPCNPSGPDDDACYRSFVSSFGRMALRRPLSDAEVDNFAGLRAYGIELDDFWQGVGAGLRAFLQHPEFVYRVEIGEPVPNQPELFRLNSFEVGARLSYFLIGSTSPDWLITAAENGELGDSEGVADAAQQLLSDPRARARINRFHSLWLSYANLSREGIFGDMHSETDALIERVVFEERGPWTDVLTSTETYLTPELAEHYGLPAPAGGPGWVPYGDSGRAGLLSQGTFLSVGAKFGDTSPTQRGLLVRTRLFCQEIPDPPPDLMVDVDEPPQADPDACKIDQYFMWQDDQCKGCHGMMDPIGFGLENYDATGAFRATQVDRPECVIDGEGDFVGVGTFNGPAELADLAIESGFVEDCVARQLYRFAVGRTELDEHDQVFIDRLVQDTSAEGGVELFGFVSEYVGSEAFRLRREEGVP